MKPALRDEIRAAVIQMQSDATMATDSRHPSFLFALADLLNSANHDPAACAHSMDAFIAARAVAIAYTGG